MFRLRVAGRLAVFMGFGVALCGCVGGEIGGPGGGSARDGFDEGLDPSEVAPVLQCPGASPDVAARNGWRSSDSSGPADDSLRFELKARPTAAKLDGLVAVGAERIDSFDKAAIAVRFADNGLIDVRDGAFYASDMAYPYEPGVWYSIGIAADIDTQTYDVEIGPCGEARETLIGDASFRDNTEVSGQLSTWAVWSSQTAALEVSTPAWMASGGCAPSTCESLGQECGQPGDGCGGTLECGGCGNAELCDSGLCVGELVATPPPPACVPDTCEVVGIECGVRSDGCGGYIACGGCPSGNSCNSGICVQAPVTPASPPACNPLTCESLSRECGVASDGCGGALSCGSCQSGYSCSGGACVQDPVTPSPPPACVPHTCPSLGRECGSVSDGCGGSLSCGGCQSGYSCSGGACLQDPVTPPHPGPADSCSMGAPLSSACVCGGSVYSSGFCCEDGYSFSACSTRFRYVRPEGGGRQDGSDWANALDGLPATLERDTVYWVGAGSYASYTFDDGAGGQAGITLRKATAATHGTDAGWDPAYGSGQAVFGPLRFEGSRYTLDGGEPNGLKTVGKMGTKATVDIAGSHIVLRHVEIDGGLRKSNETQTEGACNGSNVRGNYVVFDRCEIHNIADDGIGIYADHIKVLYSKIHNLHGCGTDGRCSGPCYNGHSDGLELSSVSDIELVGNMVYDVRMTAALIMGDFAGSDIYDLVAHNNVFYTPDSGFAVYLQDLHRAKIHNNIIWGRTQGNRYGGLAVGQSVTELEMYNNIILNINYSHKGASYDPSHHDLDYNLFGMINSGEYQANTNDLVANPLFAGIPMSGDAADHKRSITLEDFVPAASEAIDTGTDSGSVPTYDIAGKERPQGGAWDRGVFEATP